MDLGKEIKAIFDERGITYPKDRIVITERECIGRSDFAEMHIVVYEYRHKKPCMSWDLIVNIVKKYIDFGRSKFCYL